ncbi:uncharacterized protein [Ptychodera flava]|uniref:uncharacterized protein n=1 Tax=Ptychodera flava TaxID=63121 RepID=UPI00396A6C61
MAKRPGGSTPCEEFAQPAKRSAVSGTIRTKAGPPSYENREWQLWGPYLSDRQWRTVREDNTHGNELCHDLSHRLSYKWGEDGLLGISDNQATLCCSVALWNGKDQFLKERLYGLMPGNHGEDVKECYYYLDNTPTHCHMRALYKYPQNGFPYQELVDENTARTVEDEEYELEDNGVFDKNEYWDVEIEYAKVNPYTVLCQYTLHNRGPARRTVHVLPTVWFRNTWSWGKDFVDYPTVKPSTRKRSDCEVLCSHETLGDYMWMVDVGPDKKVPQLLFTENESNMAALGQKMDWFEEEYTSPFTKDSFHRYIIDGDANAVNPANTGTKCAALYVCDVRPGESAVIRTCLTAQGNHAVDAEIFQKQFDQILQRRRKEANSFYEKILPHTFTPQEVQIARQAYAGLLWSKQFYFYHMKQWLADESQLHAKSDGKTETLRNYEWTHLINKDIISMPDKWEFPWYASWDLAFHMIPFVEVDPSFAKEQLLLMLSDGYMHPNGQLPAYEYAFSDVNPPVHAWACLCVYKQTNDRQFLAKCFHRLLLNFGWWVNTKNPHGDNLFTGGFLGLDNIAPINRSDKPPGGGVLLQADATGWMAFYSLKMLEIALELARHDPLYSDMATKFLQHFLLISGAINHPERGLWDATDGFYYDKLCRDDGDVIPMKVHSLVGIVPIFACCVLDSQTLKSVPAFQQTLLWFENYHKDLMSKVISSKEGDENKLLLSLADRCKLEHILHLLFDEDEFLSPFGIRSLSKIHETKPFSVEIKDTCQEAGRSDENSEGATDGSHVEMDDVEIKESCQQSESYSVSYAPGESNSKMFGGNSNWRGPVWFCMNFLIIESLLCCDKFYGDKLLVEFPTGSGEKRRLKEIARELCQRLASIFLPDDSGRRPCHGKSARYSEDPHWRELLLFYEYFHGDTGRGCGASHQTGWTALIVNCLKMLHTQL